MASSCPYCQCFSGHPGWCPSRSPEKALVREDWITEGRCGDLDPRLFTSEFAARIAPIEALQACLSCPVRMLCLEWSVRTDQEGSVWAGATPKERRRLRSKGLTEHRMQEHFERLEERVALMLADRAEVLA